MAGVGRSCGWRTAQPESRGLQALVLLAVLAGVVAGPSAAAVGSSDGSAGVDVAAALPANASHVPVVKLAKGLEDLRRTLNVSSESSDHEHPAVKAEHRKLLFFWAVGTSEDAQKLIQQNVRAARHSAGQDCCDVFLAHYAGGPEDWPQAWYKAEVVGHTARKGFKFQLLQDAVRTRRINPQRYDFVWVLDEDIDLTKTDIGEVLSLASDSDALIMGPSLLQRNGPLTWKIQEPHGECRYRYTNYVEVIAPLLRSEALRPVLSDCDGCIHSQSVWGLDGVWCNFVASRRPELTTPETACAILDDTPVLHQNWKTLTNKYHGRRREDSDFRTMAQHDADDVKRRYPKLYVTGRKQHVFQCVDALQGVRPRSAAFRRAPRSGARLWPALSEAEEPAEDIPRHGPAPREKRRLRKARGHVH